MAVTKTITNDAEIYTQWVAHPYEDLSGLFDLVEKSSRQIPDSCFLELAPRRVLGYDGTVSYQHWGPKFIEDEFGKAVYGYLSSNKVPVYLVDMPLIESSRKNLIRGGLSAMLSTFLIFNYFWNKAKSENSERLKLEDKGKLLNPSRRCFCKNLLKGIGVTSVGAALVAPSILTIPNAFTGEEGPVRYQLRKIGSSPGIFGESYFYDARNAAFACRINQVAEEIKREKGKKAIIVNTAGAGHGGLVDLLRNSAERDRILNKFRSDFDSLHKSAKYGKKISWGDDGTPKCENVKMLLY